MVYPDINNLKDFYTSPLGAIMCRRVREYIHNLWPEVGSGASLAEPEYVCGVGYAEPYMRPLFGQAEECKETSCRISCAVLNSLGDCNWPSRKKNFSFQTGEYDLPFDDERLDRIVVVHALEHSRDVHHFMRELWRVLKPGGKLMIVVPNRRGMWAHAEHTPFGYGMPFSKKQLNKLLLDTLFMPKTVETTIFTPPSSLRLILKASDVLEKMGLKLYKPFGGIVVAEAEKQLYAPTAETIKETSKQFVDAVGVAD